MLVLGLLLSFALPSSSLIYHWTGNPNLIRNNGSYPYSCSTLLFKFQWGQDFDFDNLNHSITEIGSTCAPLPSSFRRGNILVVTGSAPCTTTFNIGIPNFVGRGVAAIIPMFVKPFLNTLNNFMAGTNVADYPYVQCSNYASVSDYFYDNIDFDYSRGSNHLTFGTYPTTNRSAGVLITLTPPVVNPVWNNFLITGSPSQFFYVTTIMASISLICISCVKFVVFLHYRGKFTPAFPELCFGIGFFCGIISLFLGMAGPNGGWGSSPSWAYQIIFFFQFWPLLFCCSVAILFGFYLAEVALLTSANTGGRSLKVFLIPCIVILFVCWLVTLVAGGILANPSVQTANVVSSGNTMQTVSFAFLLIVLSVQFVIAAGGSVLILVKSFGTDARKKVLSLCMIVIFASSGTLALGVFNAMRQGNFSDVIFPGARFRNTLPTDGSTTLLTVIGQMIMAGIFCMCIFVIMFLMTFQVSVAKEIEISKSGTSSTSSMGSSHSKSSSSSSSTSSSSSSSNDPVIEL